MNLISKSMMTLSLLLVTSTTVTTPILAQERESVRIQQLVENYVTYENQSLNISAKVNQKESAEIEKVTFQRLNRISEISAGLRLIPSYLDKVDFELIVVEVVNHKKQTLKEIEVDLTVETSRTRGKVVKVYDVTHVETVDDQPKELKFEVENQSLLIETTEAKKIAVVYEETLESAIETETTLASLSSVAGIQATIDLASNRQTEIDRVISDSNLPDTTTGPTIELPTTPERPVLPERPETPQVPETPEQPEIPLIPEVPVVPIVPEVPSVPEQPEKPERPPVVSYRYAFLSQEEAERYATELKNQHPEIQSYEVKEVEGKGYIIEYVTEPQDFDLSTIETQLFNLDQVNTFLQENQEAHYRLHKAKDSEGNDLYLLVKDTATVPEEPETPNQPEVPETPEEPETPNQPEVPETPEEPETPNQPEVPETPEEPETPSQPEVPETPKESETPNQPEVSGETAEPATLPEGISEALRSQHEAFLANGYAYAGTDASGAHTYTKSFE